MNNDNDIYENYEEAGTPSVDEARKILKALGERGVLMINRDDMESRSKLVELGLTMPMEKEGWMLFDSEREAAMYTFLRFRNPARGHSRPGLVVLRFDYAKYRSNPLAPDLELGEACSLFRSAIAAVADLDVMNCTLGFQSHSLN